MKMKEKCSFSTEEKGKKIRNQTFNYLYVLAIIMVLDSHVSSRIGILSSIFPYDSFFMPLFVFASGYFYKRTGIIKNVEHKTKKLFLPHILWSFMMLVVAFFIDRIFSVNWAHIPTFHSLMKLLFLGTLSSINGAAWFIIMLFWVSIFYNFVNHLLKESKLSDLFYTFFYFILGSASVYLCIKGYSTKGDFYLFALRTAFYIQFYHYGFMFQKYLEKILKRYRKIIVCSICVLINVLLILFFQNKINFYATSDMKTFYHWYLPIITSMTGILFYYDVMSFFAKKIGQIKIVDFISRNTFVILQTHLLFLNIPNFYVYSQIQHGSTLYADFNVRGFVNSAWIRYSSNTKLIGFFCGLIGSLLVAYLLEKIKKYFMKKMSDKSFPFLRMITDCFGGRK